MLDIDSNIYIYVRVCMCVMHKIRKSHIGTEDLRIIFIMNFTYLKYFYYFK